MAFGDLKQAASENDTEVFSSNAVTLTSTAVVAGDLVYAVFIEATTRTSSAVTDNLGNSYAARDAGTDAGAVTARGYYSRVTVAGNLTQVNFAATAGARAFVALVAVYAGPFSVAPLDQNPANITTDVASPFACPPTGVLTQADEMVVAWGAANYTTAWAAASPMTASIEDNSSAIKGMIASKVVAATTTTTPSFTAGSNPTQAILATSTFKRAITSDTVTVTQATVTLTGKTVTVRDTEKVAVTQATVTAAGKTVTVRELELVVVAKTTVTVAGKAVAVSSSGVEAITVEAATVAFAGKTVTISETPTVIYVDKALLAFTGKPLTFIEKVLINRATVTFTGKTVSVVSTTFEAIPKYIIRGRGSRHALWTQNYGGTIKGRGSRAFLVMK